MEAVKVTKEAGLLNVQEAANYLGLAKQTMYNMVSKRRVVYVKLGRRLLFRPEDLQRMIEAGRIEARSTAR
jgi:excisionase family DNA binding protein